MIRRRDQVRLSVQKLALRKKRAVFAIISVALGAIVVVAVSSLVDGVRTAALKTMWTEELDPDVVRVYARDNPYEYRYTEDDQTEKTKKRFQYLTEQVFDEMRGWPGVAAVERPVTVGNVTIDVFAERPQPVSMLYGMPSELLRRYVDDPARLTGCTNSVPLVIGERLTRLKFNEKKKNFELAAENEARKWLGRDVEIVLGNNYAALSPFNYDYEKREYRKRDEQDMASAREAMERNFKAQYDATIFNTTLRLKGRIVGLRDGHNVWVPVETATLCDKWLTQRNRLASLRPPPEVDPEVYSRRGRRAPKAGEFTEAIVVVKKGGNVEAIAKKITELGFSVTTRARAFESQVKSFDSGFRVVKIVAYAFGGILLGLAGALIWSTTSKVVSDSRADIGLFRALGATKQDIRRLFLTDSVLLGLLGTFVGMVFGWLLAYGISRWVLSFARRQVFDPEEALLVPSTIFSINAKFCLLLLAGTAVLALAAGLIPANRAANVDPVKALKRE